MKLRLEEMGPGWWYVVLRDTSDPINQDRGLIRGMWGCIDNHWKDFKYYLELYDYHYKRLGMTHEKIIIEQKQLYK